MSQQIIRRLTSALEHIAGDDRPNHHPFCDCPSCVAHAALEEAATAGAGTASPNTQSPPDKVIEGEG